jgi:hypothetical protein
MTLSREMLTAIANAPKFDSGGQRARRGLYTLEVKKILYEMKRNNKLMFITESEIITATKTDPAEEPNAVGSTVSDAQNMGLEGAQGRVKKMVEAIVDSSGLCAPDSFEKACEKDPDLFVSTLNDLIQGAAIGLRYQAEVYEGTTKKGQKQNWFRYSAIDSKQNTPELVAARRGTK